MGQYFKIVNLDKKQFLHPHKFDDGLKLMEFGRSSDGTMAGLAILLADSNGRGGGDCRSESPWVGTWAGDRIVITGDYADEGKWGDGLLYDKTVDDEDGTAEYEDISEQVLRALVDDMPHADRHREQERRGLVPTRVGP